MNQAVAEGSQLDDVVVLGPTEEPFGQLVAMAVEDGAPELARGARLLDTAALTGYVLLVYDAEIEVHDGAGRSRRETPLLIRFSGAGAFKVDWESLLALAPDVGAAEPLTPAMRADGLAAARAALTAEVNQARAERGAWVATSRKLLDRAGHRYQSVLAGLPAEVRRDQLAAFARLKADRVARFADIERVHGTEPRLLGWVSVAAGDRSDALGYDPDSERAAVATVLAELERLGFVVDDRQTAGVGYDLFARHGRTREQRLVEVKGFTAGLGPVWLERHEWAQAQQRGTD